MVKSADQVDEIIKKVLDELRREVDIDAAILFGSYATGRAHEDSDIDLAVFSKTIDKWNIEQRIKLIGRMRRVDPFVELHLYSRKALREARPTNFPGHIIETGKKVA